MDADKSSRAPRPTCEGVPMKSNDIINDIRLSHHCSHELDRCLLLPFRGKRFAACTRCCGGMLGIISGGALVAMESRVPCWIFFLAPVDWVLALFRIYRGNNIIRMCSGIVIGWLYIINIAHIVAWKWDWRIAIADAFIIVAAGIGIFYQFRKRANTFSKMT